MRNVTLASFAVVFVAAACKTGDPVEGRAASGGLTSEHPGSADPPATPHPEHLQGGAAALPTRLRLRNACDQPIWIAHSDNVPDAQNIRLDKGQSHDVPIPDGGLAAVRFWPKLGCDATGHACAIGDSGEGGGTPCPASGCQPPIDSKFEATFSPIGGAEQTWYNLSQVDGYTLPFKVTPRGPGSETGSCVTSDCSGLRVEMCPGSEDMTGGGLYSQYGQQDLRVRDASGAVLGCMAPCKKWNYPAPWGLGQPESADPGLHLCCPTPIDPAKNPGACTPATSCMTSEACSDAADPLSVVRSDYVAAMRSMCPSAYSYAYDDAAGLHACPSQTTFEVVFCP
jgi:thaumatin family protein